MKMDRSFASQIWISGSPRPYVLFYSRKKGDVAVELQSFRPDPAAYLEIAKKYPATLVFEPGQSTLEFLRKIVVDTAGRIYTFYRF